MDQSERSGPAGDLKEVPDENSPLVAPALVRKVEASTPTDLEACRWVLLLGCRYCEVIEALQKLAI